VRADFGITVGALLGYVAIVGWIVVVLDIE
jgi:hypothetical protein